MFETIKVSFSPAPDQHRRYVLTSGDQDSLRRLLSLESLVDWAFLGSLAGSGSAHVVGTRDTFTIPRARKVHQPLYTAPYTSLVAAIASIKALTTIPSTRYATEADRSAYKYPHVIVTNGPGTGFIIALVAYILKLVAIIPATHCKVVYIESWARTTGLSLTGKLFYGTGIAEVFGVQHQELAEKYKGAVYVGEVGATEGALMGPGEEGEAGN
ncbi:family 1 putative glycosyltransferase [Triangularia verruculosa]|uniref:UDP-N-acetylglucosamine transferase subunit ALG14 n=1 Tax=Triangularia verruculosa TaxID=2587418 RepID=A0AAN7AYW2_9PEZI|nr:family 1 putative glycosyltransferase [Triangularia verruculosa]